MQAMHVTDPKLAWAIGVVDRQTRQMERLVDDLMDVSRIICGKMQLAPRVVAVSEVVDQALDASRQQLEARGHLLRLELPSEPLYLLADPARLAQVLTNLLNNAAKYTPEGGNVTLRVEARPDLLVISVTDDGDGIDPQLRRSLFRLFTQGPRALERTGGGSKSGLGLGLAIAARLAELHRGRIEVDSAGPGLGASFSVILPRVSAPGALPVRAHARAAAAPPALSVLVVDDNADAADSMAMLLSALGQHVSVCHTGAEALAAAARERPRVVLLDLGMPDMDGFEIARRLRTLEKQRESGPESAQQTADSGGRGAPPRMLLAAVSGYGDGRTRERGRQAGIDLHLIKPVSGATLAALLRDEAGNGDPQA
jgi:CheY-like chemotaxis protein